MNNPLAYSIADVCKMTGIGRTSLYTAIKEGRLRAVKHFGRTLILASDLQAFLHSLPALNTGVPRDA